MTFNIPKDHTDFAGDLSRYRTEIRCLVGNAWRYSVFYRTRLSDGSACLGFEEALNDAKGVCDEVVEHYAVQMIDDDSDEMLVLNLLNIQRISENLDLMFRMLRGNSNVEGDGADVIDDYFRPITDANNFARANNPFEESTGSDRGEDRE